MKYDIAIITVSTNRLDAACIESVRDLIRSTPLKVQFVVVDNNSTLYDAETYVHQYIPEALVIKRDKNYGFGDSSNVGAHSIDAHYYYFLNPDTKIQNKEHLLAMYQFMKKNPHAGIVAPKLFYPNGNLQETCREFPRWYTPIAQRAGFLFRKKARQHINKFQMRYYNHERTRMVDWVQGSAMFMDGELYKKTKGFDQRFFMYYEDIDLCRQVWEENRGVYYFTGTEICHAYGRESAKERNPFKAVVSNKKARIHIASWIRYTMKWGLA